MKVLYVVSLFPCWSETFIVREIHGMLDCGADVRILSLRAPSEELVQTDAAALLGRVIYPEAGAAAAVRSLLAVAGHPLREIGFIARLAGCLFRHPAAFAKSLVAWWRMLGALAAVRRFGPGHVHAHFATYPSTSALAIARALGVPFSFTAHAHDIFLENHLLAAKLRASAFTVVISDFNRRFIESLEPQAARQARFRLVHCGVSPGRFAFRREGRDPRRLVAVGRLDAIKGFEHLVDACAILARGGVAFDCRIVGSGPLREALEERVRGAGLGERVTLLGAMPQEQVRAELDCAGAFVMPSVVTPRGDRDGIPVALMEAMACGLPVVSTRVSGIPELVEDGVTGLLAEPGDAGSLAGRIASLMADAALADRLATAARQRVEREFNIHAESAKLHDAILGAS